MLTSRSVKVLLGIENSSLSGGSTFFSVPSLVLPSVVGAHAKGKRKAESLESDIEGDTLGELWPLLCRERV